VKVKPTLKNFRAFDVFEKKNYTYLGLVKVKVKPTLKNFRAFDVFEKNIYIHI